MNNKTIPIFYACDDGFSKYAVVSISSLIKSAGKNRDYQIYVLHSGLSEQNSLMLTELGRENISVTPVDVGEYLSSVDGALPIRDYYTKTTYYRFFIPEMFPQYDKAVYVDSDTVVQRDIAALFDIDLGDRTVGACHEEVMVQTDVYGRYCEQVLGIPRDQFFNAGVMLMNCKSFRERGILDRFVSTLSEYNFVVTQDEDYLNLLCKDRVFWLDGRWNTEICDGIRHAHNERDSYILHFIMTSKPWHYPDVRLGDIFWKFAERTDAYAALKEELEEYTDEERLRDRETLPRLAALAEAEIARPDNYLKRLNAKRAPDRVRIYERIEEFEREGNFGTDVEDDPPTKMLMPDDIDYLRRGVSDKLKTAVAHIRAKRFLRFIIKKGLMVIKDVRGKENLAALDSGAVITCNHFNPFDSFALHHAYLLSGQKRRLYRVIREGNYTSFGGFYGFLMRNFHTLPLSSNIKTLQKFNKAVDTLLKEGALIAVYPEGSMWHNYRKPKPLKSGAFLMAAKNGVPVLPVFITMTDSDRIGDDGYPIQEYTVHIDKPIAPQKDMHYRDAAKAMAEENYRVWKSIYEREYGIKLTYRTTEERISENTERSTVNG